MNHTEQAPISVVHGPYGLFRNNHKLMVMLVTLLVSNVFLTVFSSGFLSYLQLNSQKSYGNVLTDYITKLDQITILVSIGQHSVYFTIAIIACAWINRVCKNAWLLDAPHMKIAPGWSVGHYFIPVLNLWKPYMAMKDIRRTSYGNDHSLDKTLPLWWTMWLLFNVISLAVVWTTSNADNRENYVMANKLKLIKLPIEVALSISFSTIVMNITRTQKMRFSQWR
jgi:hypothetical protein